ncbi:MAG: major facilitator superfamily 1 [Actinotalea sp.]|nr:major facilitator superfamily 1 [Actinotalea sp.]
MTEPSRRIVRTYLVLVAGNTLAASLIWGINTLFLLDAGLTNLEAFAANAFFTAGMVIFEIPTGVVADARGRRISYLTGTVVLSLSTLLYYLLWVVHGPFWQWAVVSVLLGLGFTFFSGAVEAWLVDALASTDFTGSLEAVFGRAQVVMGVAMLTGAVGGGVVAQATSLGVPFVLRVVALLVMTVVAALFMRDLGFTPDRTTPTGEAVRGILRASVRHGLANPPVRWLMVAAPFVSGVGIYAFYAMQPYLLELYGDDEAYAVAGLAAAIVAGSQIAGGVLAPRVRRLFARRTSAVILGTTVGAVTLALLGITRSVVLALALLVIGGLVQAAVMPVRQAYLNDLIPSRQRATVLSFDSLMGSVGGVVVQPALGKTADLTSYGTSYVVGAAIQLVAVPFLVLSRRQRAAADSARGGAPQSGD